MDSLRIVECLKYGKAPWLVLSSGKSKLSEKEKKNLSNQLVRIYHGRYEVEGIMVHDLDTAHEKVSQHWTSCSRAPNLYQQNIYFGMWTPAEMAWSAHASERNYGWWNILPHGLVTFADLFTFRTICNWYKHVVPGEIVLSWFSLLISHSSN